MAGNLVTQTGRLAARWAGAAALVAVVALGGCGGSSDADSGGGSEDVVDTISGGGWQFGDAGGGTVTPDGGQVATDTTPWETTACQSDFDCEAPTPYCDLAAGACVACRSSNDCGGRACVAGACEGDATGCQPGSRVCVGTTAVVCDAAGNIADQINCAPNVCVDGVCALCHPEQVSCQGDDVVRCKPDASGFIVVESCPEGCAEGRCVTCFPATGKCEYGKALRCNEDGSAWVVEQDCAAQGWDCVSGACVSPCATDPKTQTNAGCDFWAVDLDNAYHVAGTGDVYDAQNAQFAVIVSNTDDAGAADVTITMPDGQKVERTVASRTLETFLLPSTFGHDGTSVSRNAFHVESNRPVTVYQFNPLANVDVFSNDASVLLPTPSLGTEYYVATHVENPAYRAYVTVIAVQPGETVVTVRPTVKTLAGDGVPAMTPGAEHTVSLQRGDVLNLETDQVDGDLSGTYVRTSQRAIVFSGHEAAAPTDACCLDHLEQQLLPVSRWGRRYLATRSMQRGLEKDHWMILSATPGNRVQIEPAVASLPASIDAGVPVRFQSDRDFVLTAEEPILLVQYLASSFEILGPYNLDSCWDDSECPPGYECWGSCDPPQCSSDAQCPAGHTCVAYPSFGGICEPIGDPAMILSVPVEQYRKEFIFLTPNSYLEDYLNVIAPSGANVQLDGQAIPAGSFIPIGSSGYGVHRQRVSDGVHVVSSDQPVGLVVYGYDDDVSYGYPGGLGLEALSERPNQ